MKHNKNIGKSVLINDKLFNWELLLATGIFRVHKEATKNKSDLRKAAHEVSQSLWIWALQLLDNLKTLV